MKTILLILFLTCFGLGAQTPPPSADSADPDELMRSALRSATSNNPHTNTANPPPAMMQPSAPPPAMMQPSTPRGALRRNSGAFALPPGGPLNAVTPLPAPGTVPPPPGVPGGLPANPAAPADASANPAEQTSPPVDINFEGASIEEVLKIYADLVNRTVLHAQLPPILITLKSQTPLTRAEAIQALESIFSMYQITVVPVGDKFVKVVSAQVAPLLGTPFSTNDVDKIPEGDQFITHIVNLKVLKPSDVVSALTPLAQLPNAVIPVGDSNMILIRDYASNVKRMLELIKQLDVEVPMEWDSKVIPIKYALADDIASALSSLGGGTGTSIGSGSRTGAGGARTGGFGGGTGGIGGIGSGTLGSGAYGGGLGQPGVGSGINQPGGLSTGARTSSLSDRIGKIVSNAAKQGEFNILGETKIIADKRTNSLLVFAGKQDMAMIEKIVSQLDIVLAQVLIEAIIMEVSLDTSHSVGVSYIQKNASTPGNYFSGIGAVNNGTFLSPNNFLASGTNGQPNVPSGLSYLANFGGDFDATLTAIANDSHINVLSRPRIQTSHGVAATLQVGQQVPIVSGTYFGGLNGQASSQYTEQFVGISLTVTPLINPDGLVVMDISQNVQQLGPNYTIDGNPVPSTTQRSAQATVSVRDRDTIVLGGMIQTSKNVSNAGVPLLKDIPGIGFLFRSSSSDSQRTELIVLIRPTVLPTPEAAALVATHELNKLPAIKAAEAEERIDAAKRMKAADKIKMPKDMD